jgi:hypothetical protein
VDCRTVQLICVESICTLLCHGVALSGIRRDVEFVSVLSNCTVSKRTPEHCSCSGVARLFGLRNA